MIYLDACALVKLVITEEGSDALEEHIAGARKSAVSSELSKVEVHRTLRRLGASREDVDLADEILGEVAKLPLSPAVNGAAKDFDAMLRSLDALHLETARLLGMALTEFISYDKRLVTAARILGLPVVQPGITA